MATMRTLEHLIIKNFKSIRDQTLALGALNVFIGGNGAGKSNLIQVFRFLRELVNQRLAKYTGIKGGADTLLYFGGKRSPEMSIMVNFAEGDTANAYSVKLNGTEDGALMIATEYVYHFSREKRLSACTFHPIPTSRSSSSRIMFSLVRR
jgi:predicted ATPase